MEHITTATHRIELEPPKTRLFHSAPYRAGPQIKQKVREEIQKMLDVQVTEQAQTEWASPIVFVPKKDG